MTQSVEHTHRWAHERTTRRRHIADVDTDPRATDERRFAEMTEYLRHLGMEDKELVESVQRGLRSGAVPHGRLMLDSEHLIQRFQALVLDALSDTG